MTQERRSVVRKARFFADLEDEECDALLRVLRARRGAPGDMLFVEGAPGDCMMIVVEGELVVHVRASTGESEEVARLGPGEVTGEMAFLDAERRSATVSTRTGAVVLEFSRAALAALARDAPRVAARIQQNVLADVTRRLREAGEQIAELVPERQRGESSPASLRPGRGLTAAELRSIPGMAAFGAEDLDLLAHVATLRSFAPGQALIEEGSRGDACWMIVSGSVTVTRARQSATLATLGPPAIVGQLALIDRAPRSATVVAAVATVALEIPARAFGSLVRAHTPLALRFQQQVALAGVRQLRLATRKLVEARDRHSTPPSSLRMLEDWDDGDGPPLELAVDLATIRR